MASSIALQYPHLDLPAEPDSAPKRSFGAGLLDRVKKVRDNLRNTSREDLKTIGLAVSAGIGAKLALTGVAAFAGVAAGGVIATLGVAAAGGVVVSLASSAVTHVRKGNSLSTLFNRESVKRASFSALLAAGTAGYSNVFEAVMGETITHALGKVAGSIFDKVVHLASGTNVMAAAKEQALSETLTSHFATATHTSYEPFAAEPTQHVAVAPEAAPEITPASAPEPVAKPAASQVAETKPSPRPTVNSSASKAAAAAALAAAQEKAANEFALNRLRELILNTTGTAAPVDATAVDLAKQFYPRNPDAFLNGLKQNAPTLNMADVKVPAAAAPQATAPVAPKVAPVAAPAAASVEISTSSAEQVVNLADLPKMNIGQIDPQNITVRTDTGVEIKLPKAPNVAAELDIVRNAIEEAGLEEQVRKDYAIYFPNSEIPKNATLADLASYMHPENPQAYLAEALKTSKAAIAAAGGQLDPAKIAASCVGDLPSTQEAFDNAHYIPNTCVTSKETMEPGDYVTIRDAAEAKPSARRGLRVLFSQFAQKTSDFISHAVSQETVPEMAAEKLGMALK